ncbi:MAG: hypothetical protein ABJ308_18995 [Halieaceae bacterium]
MNSKLDKQQSGHDPLDQLLAQPALLADRGFSTRVARELHAPASRRRLVFVAMAACWATIVALFTSPQAIMSTMARLAALLEGAVYRLVPDLFNAEIGTLGQLIVQSSLSSILLLGLVFCAGLAVFIREQS